MDNKSDKVKVELFVPALNADAVRAAIGQAGGGELGHYSHCSFSPAGTGCFKPEAGANPAIGSVGIFEEVEEEKIEFVCDRALLEDVLDAIQKVHPYEEIGLFVYPIEKYGPYNKYKRSHDMEL